jgi:hypothetical protein
VPKVNLQKREKVMVMGGAVIAVLILGAFLVEGPVDDYRDVRNLVKQARQNHRSAEMMREDALAIEQQRKALVEMLSGSQGNLYSHIFDVLKNAGLLERGAKLDSRQRVGRSINLPGVHVALKGVSTKELVDFLHGVYGGGHVVVLNELRFVKPASDGRGLDCDMTFMAPKP